MKRTIVAIMSLFLFLVLVVGATEKGPEKIVFKTKMGNVTYDHALHAEREKSDCTVCHDKLFPQSQAPLKYGQGMHRPAEKQKASCAACHVDGGKAFATKGKCQTCHVKG